MKEQRGGGGGDKFRTVGDKGYWGVEENGRRIHRHGQNRIGIRVANGT